MVNIIHDYIHEYDFPYHDHLKKHKEEILHNYFTQKEQNKFLTDFNLPNEHSLTSLLIPKLNKLVKKHYWTKKPLLNTGLRVYVQNNKDSKSFYHNHPDSCTITGVFYLDPPLEGGEILFLLNPDRDHPHKEILVKPQKNKIYLFPSWLYHKPVPQKDINYRICFNWNYGSNIIPIHKLTSIQW